MMREVSHVCYRFVRISCICILKCKHLTKCWTAENIFRGKIGYNFVEKKPPYFRPKSPYQKCPISLFGPKNVSHVWALISCAVTAQLIFVFFSHRQKSGYLMTRLISVPLVYSCQSYFPEDQNNLQGGYQ